MWIMLYIESVRGGGLARVQRNTCTETKFYTYPPSLCYLNQHSLRVNKVIGIKMASCSWECELAQTQMPQQSNLHDMYWVFLVTADSFYSQRWCTLPYYSELVVIFSLDTNVIIMRISAMGIVLHSRTLQDVHLWESVCPLVLSLINSLTLHSSNQHHSARCNQFKALYVR